MIMDVAKQLDIFALHESAVSVFAIIPDEANNGDLRTFIEFAGGVVLSPGEDDPYKIPILDADWYLNVKKTSLPKFNLKQNDIFLPAFIYESYEKERVMNLNNYRYGESSFSKYNANEILRRELPWADLIPLKIGEDTKKSAGSRNSTSKVTPAPSPRPSPSPSKLNGSNKSEKITQPQRKEQEKQRKQNVVVSPPPPTITTIDLCGSSSSSSDSSTTITHGSPQNRKRRVVSDYDIDSDSSGDQQPRNRKQRSFRHRSRERVSESRTSTASSLSPKKDTRIEAEASSIPRQREGVGRRQAYRPYNTKEGQAILDYIFNHNEYKRSGGVAIWKDMEGSNVGEQGRTYQSLKEHFRKHVTKNLGHYEMTEEQKTKLKKGLKETAENGRGRRRKASPRRWR